MHQKMRRASARRSPASRRTLALKVDGTMAVGVLLADDHTIVRQAVKLLLEREGFQVVGEAADGHQAVRLARQLQPDVAALAPRQAPAPRPDTSPRSPHAH